MKNRQLCLIKLLFVQIYKISLLVESLFLLHLESVWLSSRKNKKIIENWIKEKRKYQKKAHF